MDSHISNMYRDFVQYIIMQNCKQILKSLGFIYASHWSYTSDPIIIHIHLYKLNSEWTAITMYIDISTIHTVAISKSSSYRQILDKLIDGLKRLDNQAIQEIVNRWSYYYNSIDSLLNYVLCRESFLCCMEIRLIEQAESIIFFRNGIDYKTYMRYNGILPTCNHHHDDTIIITRYSESGEIRTINTTINHSDIVPALKSLNLDKSVVKRFSLAIKMFD